MSVPKYWREIPQRYRLEAGRCKKCGKLHYPPRLICDACKSRDFETDTLSDEGTILTYTVIHTPPSQFKDQAPYAIAIIETDNGARTTLQIADTNVEELAIGKRVKLQFRKIQEEGDSGIICYGNKAVIVT
ncbi:Zn-ribbon domain-containing OB-fold protein [candidate division CSSED10-310 bacterium]|uniref:Zn-ribbon domain-containing OB-fold protein n=1 Tax=candidate division CSSED10-310 bacterium TaxID=2855610 RepID=A0ABV6YW96_UNCC1